MTAGAFRDRRIVLACVAVSIVLGLASRRYGSALPAFVTEYAGDTLWAVMVYWLLATFFRSSGAPGLFIGTIGIAFAVEASQLGRTPWLDALRADGFGALVLGSGFVWSDLVCYVAGACIAVVVDRVLFRS
jgi:hypothetical protein